MKKIFFVLMLMGSLLLVQSLANADLLINEGPGAGYETVYGTWYPAENVHGVAEDFSVPVGEIWTVDTIYSYFPGNYDGFWDKPMTFSIYNDDGSGGVGSSLYSANYALPRGDAAWRGVSGLSWDLSPGDYWTGVVAVGDIIRYPHNGDARMVYTSGAWSSSSGNNIGLRIYGTAAPAPVPEPATMLLLGTGLIGLAAFRRKFRKR